MSRSYYIILMSQSTTNLGFALYTMLVTLYVYSVTSSTTIASFITLISLLFRMIGSATLPLLSSRRSFRFLFITSQSVQLAFLLCFVWLFRQSYSDILTLAFMFAIIAMISFFNGWFVPIKSTIIRSVVAENQRVKANGLISVTDQTFQFIGWAFGGITLSFLGKDFTLWITISLVLVSLSCLFFLNIKQKQGAKGSPINRLKKGWSTLFQHQDLKVLLVMDLIESWAGMIWTASVSLAYVSQVLHKDEAWWGYINGGYYLGTIIGGIVIFKVSDRLQKNLLFSMFLGAIVYGVFTVIYGLLSNPYLALILVLLMGPAFVLRDLCQETFIQNRLDESILADIMAARSTFIQLVYMLSIIGIGVLTDVVGVRFVYVSCGVLLLIAAFYGTFHFFSRSPRQKESLDG
ncbi:MFS transporter [Bacillus changyiensis]|uniref:MFS transporter n=1 Tax=Bacillus changyiensis TaxID=3004103 RepID=UPI0022E8D17F|nr:MFS transporter [Bacillus changyiensis]MDA1477950.1 MFS transporter [Bacillus changyiensis]